MSSDVGKSYFPNICLSDLLFKSPYFRKNDIALVDGVTGAEVTYDKLFENAMRVASGLRHFGMQQGDVVALVLGNSLRQVVCLLAVLLLRSVPAPVNPSFTAYELKNIVKVSRAKYWFVSSSDQDRLWQVLETSPLQVKKVIVLEDTQNTTIISKEPRVIYFQPLLHFPPLQASSQPSMNSKTTTALLLFSSGTTGLSKGVRLSHSNFIFMLLSLSKGVYTHQTELSSPLLYHQTHFPPLSHQKNTLAFIPFFHVFGLVNALLLPLFLRSKIVLSSRFDLHHVFLSIQRYKVTEMCMVPSVMRVMAGHADLARKYDLSSLTRVFYGGLSCSRAVEEDFKRIYDVKYMLQGYGATEVCLSVLHNFPSFPPKYGSPGKPLPSTSVVIKCVKTGAELPANEVGEICVKGPQVMLGYLENEEASRDCLDGQGWLHLGDLGYYDNSGYFFIVDRMKDMIKYHGFQVSPTEIETLLKTHASVDEAVVVGVGHAAYGQLPKAIVVRKEGCDVGEQDLIDLVRKNLSGYKQLRGGVSFVAALPKSSSGKVQRKLLKLQHSNKSKL